MGKGAFKPGAFITGAFLPGAFAGLGVTPSPPPPSTLPIARFAADYGYTLTVAADYPFLVAVAEDVPG